MPSRYLPIIRLGGAATEVWLGVLLGAAGYRKPVVLKRAPDAGGALAEEARALLVREAHIASLLSHPNVVHVYELVEIEGALTLAMEYLPGASAESLLEHAIREQVTIPWPIAVRIAVDAARGLAHAHAIAGADGVPLGVVHRDVSPKNLVITEEGLTKVVDFGIARARGATVTGHGVVKGTRGYLSPEQAAGAAVDSRTDVFALGIVLYELLAGTHLLPSGDLERTLRFLRGEPPPPLPAEVPPVIGDVLARMLARDPAQRTIDARRAADALEHAAGAAGTHVEIAAFLHAELGDVLARRREGVARMMAGLVPARPVPRARAEDGSTIVLVETAVDAIGGAALPDPHPALDEHPPLSESDTGIAGRTHDTTVDLGEDPPTEIDP